MTPIRIVVEEDNTLLRSGLQQLLSRLNFIVEAAVPDAPSLCDAVRKYRPDLIVTDVRMPPDHSDDGIRAAITLREEFPSLAVVVLSQYVESSYADELLSRSGQGGIGYLLKDRIVDIEQLAHSLRQVASGGTVIDSEVIRQLLSRRRDPLSNLTKREREVLGLLAEGMSNSAIAKRLYVSEAVIVKHVGNIFAKLDLPPNDEQHRRILAVLTYLRSASD